MVNVRRTKKIILPLHMLNRAVEKRGNIEVKLHMSSWLMPSEATAKYRMAVQIPPALSKMKPAEVRMKESAIIIKSVARV